jgi:hypothetical protein
MQRKRRIEEGRLCASLNLPARFARLSAGGKRIRTVGSAMRLHRRQRYRGVTPPDPGGERRLLGTPLDNSIDNAEAGNSSGRTASAVRAGCRPPTASGRRRCAGRGRGCGRVGAARHNGGGRARRAELPGAPNDRARREPFIASITAVDEAGFAAPAGHRGHPGQAAQGVIISPAQRLPDLGEQHGEDDRSEPGHGSQDHHVALLVQGFEPRSPPRGTTLFETARSTTSAIPLPRQRTVPLNSNCARYAGVS